MLGADSSTSETNRTASPRRRAPRIFRKVGADEDADRRSDQGADADLDDCSDNRVQQTAARTGGRVTSVKTVVLIASRPRQNSVNRMEKRKIQAEYRRNDRKDRHDLVLAAALPAKARRRRRVLRRHAVQCGAVERSVAHAAAPFARGRSSRRDMASTMNDSTNRMNPSASNAESFRLPAPASPNSSATSDAMVLPARTGS